MCGGRGGGQRSAHFVKTRGPWKTPPVKTRTKTRGCLKIHPSQRQLPKRRRVASDVSGSEDRWAFEDSSQDTSGEDACRSDDIQASDVTSRRLSGPRHFLKRRSLRHLPRTSANPFAPSSQQQVPETGAEQSRAEQSRAEQSRKENKNQTRSRASLPSKMTVLPS